MNIANTQRFFIVTGGPGSGKTTLLHALAELGYRCSTEAGRAIIEEQVAINGPALPWQDRHLFAELMLSWEMRSYRDAERSSGIFLFDRGVPDVAAYLRLCDAPVPEHVRNAIAQFAYHRVVFILPPWREIFRQDRERKQDFAEAVRTYQALVDIYQANNYQLVEIPRASVEERVHFVQEHIAALHKRTGHAI